MKLEELANEVNNGEETCDPCSLVHEDPMSLGASVLDMQAYLSARRRAEALVEDTIIVVNEEGLAEYCRRFPDGHIGALGGE